MNTSKKNMPALSRSISKIAARMGATIIMEPTWNVVAQITFKNGKRTYFQFSSLDINPLGSAKISRDKDFASFFMKKMGYPVVPKSKTFFSDSWADEINSPDRKIDAAYDYAQQIGFPVIAKPNSGSQGKDVFVAHNKKELYSALRLIFKSDRIALVQKPVHGKEYRIVVLDSEIIAVYERIPLTVIGNGTDTIDQLLSKKFLHFKTMGRVVNIKQNDPRITARVRKQGYSMATILPNHKQLYLLNTANLSTGGDSIDVTETIHPEFKRLAIKLTKDMGLRLNGIDIIVKGTISEKPAVFWIIEINASPGLDHFAKIGKKQSKIVEELYTKILKHLEKTC